MGKIIIERIKHYNVQKAMNSIKEKKGIDLSKYDVNEHKPIVNLDEGMLHNYIKKRLSDLKEGQFEYIVLNKIGEVTVIIKFKPIKEVNFDLTGLQSNKNFYLVNSKGMMQYKSQNIEVLKNKAIEFLKKSNFIEDYYLIVDDKIIKVEYGTRIGKKEIEEDSIVLPLYGMVFYGKTI